LLIPLIGIFIEAVWLFICSMLIASDIVRNVRWRRDYEVGLCLMLRTMQRPELM
jgi:hypothetical protein